MDETPYLSEILSQPAAIKTCIDYYASGLGKDLLVDITTLMQSKRKLIFTGMGTSLHSPYILFKELSKSGKEFDIVDASELLHFGLNGFKGDEIIIAVSQSGESAETKRVVNKLKGKLPILSIVNDLTSSMARNSDYVLPLHAGNEAAISTKTYTNTLTVLLILSSSLSESESNDQLKVFHELKATAYLMESQLNHMRKCAKRAADYFNPCDTLQVVARGTDLVTARQMALIAKEGAGLFSEAMSAGLFRHGPIELAGMGHNIIFILSEDNEPVITKNLSGEIKNMGSNVLVISDDKRKVSSESDVYIESPLPRYFPLLCATFIEYFVHETAALKGKEAGVFSHATKITNKE